MKTGSHFRNIKVIENKSNGDTNIKINIHHLFNDPMDIQEIELLEARLDELKVPYILAYGEYRSGDHKVVKRINLRKVGARKVADHMKGYMLFVNTSNMVFGRTSPKRVNSPKKVQNVNEDFMYAGEWSGEHEDLTKIIGKAYTKILPEILEAQKKGILLGDEYE